MSVKLRIKEELIDCTLDINIDYTEQRFTLGFVVNDQAPCLTGKANDTHRLVEGFLNEMQAVTYDYPDICGSSLFLRGYLKDKDGEVSYRRLPSDETLLVVASATRALLVRLGRGVKVKFVEERK
jgi:hypothetical protein